MRTGRVRQPDPLLSSGGQKGRLVFLVVVLAFMMYSIHWASQGRHWAWLVRPQAESTDAVPELREIELTPRK
ncbi:MAG: hypothetical protein U0929_07190 [Planctomycetaceae bacterium]